MSSTYYLNLCDGFRTIPLLFSFQKQAHEKIETAKSGADGRRQNKGAREEM